MVLKKTHLTLSFDEEALFELRKALFKEGLSPQEFFAFIIERIMLEDERTEALIQELCDLKKDELVKGGVNRKFANADSLYDVIEATTERYEK